MKQSKKEIVDTHFVSSVIQREDYGYQVISNSSFAITAARHGKPAANTRATTKKAARSKQSA